MKQLARRGFFSLMASAGAGLLLPDTILFDPVATKPVHPDLIGVNLHSVTSALSSLFHKEMGMTLTIEQPRGFRCGENGFTSQSHVAIWFPYGEVSNVHERFIEPAAVALANACKNKGLIHFGKLQLPTATESASVGAIRGIMQPYCVVCDNDPGEEYQCQTCGRMGKRMVFRFDVLGKAS